MKLDKQQIDALASKIKSELDIQFNTTIKEHNDKINESNEYINFETENKIALKFKQLFDDNNIDGYYCRQIISELKDKYFKKKYQKEKSFDYYQIKNSIILNTIECDNLDSIIEKIKKEFSK